MESLTRALNRRIRRDYGAKVLKELFLRLDRRHDYASAGQLASITPLSRAELRGWREDILYTARETRHEIEGGPNV